MRVIGEVPHNQYKITLFQWNGKFLIKIESGMLEQTYKLDEWDVTEIQLSALLDDEFMKFVSSTFRDMHLNLQRTLNDH